MKNRKLIETILTALMLFVCSATAFAEDITVPYTELSTITEVTNASDTDDTTQTDAEEQSTESDAESTTNEENEGVTVIREEVTLEITESTETDIEINTFDYQTSEAMSQVEANSIKNILTQLNPDENDWQREVARQADLLYKLQDERDKAVEYCRLLRKENKDLKDFLQEKGLIDENLQVIEDQGVLL